MIETARDLALRRDANMHDEATAIELRSVNSFFITLRVYLEKQNDRIGAKNDIYGILKRAEDPSGLALFNLGPQIDKCDTQEHFHFPSGARLSFGITVRARANCCSLVSYRFHHHMPEGSSPAFLRFDLNSKLHQDPLIEPKCHLHPGRDDVRIPMPALTPSEVLDRIFFVVEGG
jgi:hypothetical protein